MEAPLASQARHLARCVQPSTESKRLDCGSRCEISSRDAVRESRVVLDSRACAGLPPNRDGIEAYRAKTLRSTVDRRCQAGRAASDHDEIEDEAGDGLKCQSKLLREGLRSGPRQDPPWG